MKQLITIISTVIAMTSCSISETGLSQRPQGEDIWKNPVFNNDSSSTVKTRCYVTGLDYPVGYNWRADPEKGTVKCSLVVFADEVPVMKIPVGHEYNVSPDPDMHRMLEGHLYTDYSTAEETIIKKDGTELFRYEGREMILDMSVSQGYVYTLGRPRHGEGFTYRKNGEILIESNIGHAFPRLQNIDDTLHFAFSEPIESVSETLERYYHVKNGEVMQVAIREDVKKVWDVIWHNDNACYLASMTGVSAPVSVDGHHMKALEFSEGIDMLTSRLLSAGKSLGVEAICLHGKHYSSCLWKDAVKHKQFPKDMTISSICTSGDGICCTLNSGSSSTEGVIFRCGEIHTMPMDYAAMGNNPIDMMDGILHIGLSSLSGGKPVIWKDGQTEELDINGMICTLTVY